jgi:antagonist of KipI
VPAVMGSRSTYLRARVGGLEGRALQAGDWLPTGAATPMGRHIAERIEDSSKVKGARSVPWFAGLAPSGQERILRVVRGAEFEKLTPDSQRTLFSAEFEVTSESDRMGYRLTGPPLLFNQPTELVSAAVCPGTFQIPPQGQPILLMADCATTGGYPKVAHVASADLPLAGQLRPGDCVRLRDISLAEAHNLCCRQEADLRCLQTNLKLKFAI